MSDQKVEGHGEGCLDLEARYIVAGRYASNTMPTIGVEYRVIALLNCCQAQEEVWKPRGYLGPK